MDTLRYACQGGHLPVIKYLNSNGANIEVKDENIFLFTIYIQ